MTRLTKQGVRDLDAPKQPNRRKNPDGCVSGHLYICPECGGKTAFCPLCWGGKFVVYKEKR